MRTSVYIDGFNFYYGAVRRTPYKWLDYGKLCRNLLAAHHQITAIKYFTARVSGKFDPQQPIRQQTYLRALQACIPEISIHYGQFTTHAVRAPLAEPIPGKKTVKIFKTEEKGSDVNLAVHLLNDAWLDQYECAVVVSNDSDLAEALCLVKQHHQKTIGLIFPRDKGHPSRELALHADFIKRTGRKVLAASQLPDPVPGTTLRKPASW
jgi:uncharacterized LabA/DUF88 family protein